jgi:calcium-dependent protein kinase
MLIKDEDSRLTSKEVFLRLNSAPDKKIASASIKNLKKFSITSRIQRATLGFIVNQVMASEDISNLRDTFSALDVNGDGVLSAEELKEGMKNFTGEIMDNIDELLRRVDEDGNGGINYSEFLTAAINWNKELSRERLLIAFKEFDKDGSGAISVQELLEALGGSSKEEHAFIEMIREADVNGDGQIDLEEFISFMEQVKTSNRA